MEKDVLQRLEEELKELIVKMNKLTKFQQTKEHWSLSDANRYLINKQVEAMYNYEGILKARIELNKQ